MAHSNNSVVTGKFSGSLGNEIVFRSWDGKTVVAKSPGPRTGEATPAQVKTKEKFLFASRYAKAVMNNPDPSLAEAYAMTLKPRQNLYSRIMQDFLTQPVVSEIKSTGYTGAPGGKITVRATDDFRVTGVRVEIYAPGGALLEGGNAVQDLNGLDWTYTALQNQGQVVGTRIKAIATDVPGNEGTLEKTL
jgi:hypothetical protein